MDNGNVPAEAPEKTLEERLDALNVQVRQLSERQRELVWIARYPVMKLVMLTMVLALIVGSWVLLFTPYGARWGVTPVWDALIQQAAIAVDPACVQQNGGDGCAPGSDTYKAYVEAAERAFRFGRCGRPGEGDLPDPDVLWACAPLCEVRV